MEIQPLDIKPKSPSDHLANAQKRIAEADSHKEVTAIARGYRGMRGLEKLGIKSLIPGTQARKVSKTITRVGTSKHGDIYHKKVSELALKLPIIPRETTKESPPNIKLLEEAERERVASARKIQANRAELLASARLARREHRKTIGPIERSIGRLLTIPHLDLESLESLQGAAGRRDQTLRRMVGALGTADKRQRRQLSSLDKGRQNLSLEQKTANYIRFANLVGDPTPEDTVAPEETATQEVNVAENISGQDDPSE